MQKSLLLDIFILMSNLFLQIYCAPTSNVNNDDECRDFSEIILTEILGPAFNRRYMSISKPLQRDYYLSDVSVTSDLKRGTPSMIPSFYVEDDYAQIISDEPAWIVKHSNINFNDYNNDNSNKKNDNNNDDDDGNNNDRIKRSDKYKMQWECESRIKWIDLGPDYFPRYLRTVECVAKYCWYGHYKCKPRSFTVKILKRRRDKCINVNTGSIINNNNNNVNDDRLSYNNGIQFDRDVTISNNQGKHDPN